MLMNGIKPDIQLRPPLMYKAPMLLPRYISFNLADANQTNLQRLQRLINDFHNGYKAFL